MTDLLERVVVVGASAAGLTTAEALRRGGFAGSITLIGAEPHVPYDRPPLSKQVLSGAWSSERVTLRSAKALTDLGADLRLGQRAVSLDRSTREVALASGERVAYDALVIATGVAPRRLDLGREPAGIHVMRTLEDALGLQVEMASARRMVVVGAGFMGCEVTAVARQAELEVTLVDPLPVPLFHQLGPEVGGHVAALHRSHGVDLRTGTGVSAWLGHDRVTGVRLSTGEEVSADLVVTAIGSTPAVDWLDGSGLTLDNGIVCDSRCLAADGIWAAGDVARWFHEGLGSHLRVEHRLNATEQAIAVANNILGADRPFTPVPFFWTDQYDARIQGVGTFPAGAEVYVADGDPAEGRFLAHYVADDRVVGVLGWNMPRELRAARELVGLARQETNDS